MHFRNNGRYDIWCIIILKIRQFKKSAKISNAYFRANPPKFPEAKITQYTVQSCGMQSWNFLRVLKWTIYNQVECDQEISWGGEMNNLQSCGMWSGNFLGVEKWTIYNHVECDLEISWGCRNEQYTIMWNVIWKFLWVLKLCGMQSENSLWHRITPTVQKSLITADLKLTWRKWDCRAIWNIHISFYIPFPKVFVTHNENSGSIPRNVFVA